MQDYGIECSQLVLHKESNNPKVSQILDTNRKRETQAVLEEYAKEQSLQNVLFPWGKQIMESKQFAEADLVHLHLIHNNVLSVLDLKNISERKPTVWTWHDPWALTGHCVYPMNCDLWQSGCLKCPHLDFNFSINRDTSKEHWNLKRSIAQELDISIVVASRFMENLCSQSPIAQEYSTLYRIPFGLDLSFKQNLQSASSIKSKLGIPSSNTVIFFRCDYNQYKGTKYIIEALQEISASSNITLLTVGETTLPSKIFSKFHTVQLPWQNSEIDFYNLLNCADIFLMPSTAEAFGLMAIEAMALGKPVVAFKNTSLEELISDGNDGLLASYKNSHELAICIKDLINNPEKIQEMGQKGLQKVEEQYSFSKYKKSLADCYISTFEEWHSRPHAKQTQLVDKSDFSRAAKLLDQYYSININQDKASKNKDIESELNRFVKSHLLRAKKRIFREEIITVLKKLNLLKYAMKIKNLINNQK